MGGYRVRCADCHGLDGRGCGPDITQVWNGGRTDEGLFKTIRSGVPVGNAGVRRSSHV
jgi:mono/diheme cytochrome c family protein